MLITGPPGTGKSMVAERIPGIMPAMTHDESLEVACIYSVYNKKFDFNKYSDNGKTYTGDDDSSDKKFDLKNIDFRDERNEFDPVQTDTTDSKYLFDNEDAIVVNLKKKKK